MLTKIAHGGTTFDIAIPSDYAINKMKEQGGLLIPLDHSKIPNLKYIDPRFLDLPFDENNEYSAPVRSGELWGGSYITLKYLKIWSLRAGMIYGMKGSEMRSYSMTAPVK